MGETNILNNKPKGDYTQQVAQNIYDQLGGKRFSLITGCRDYRTIKNDGGSGITFTVPATRPNLITRVKIYLSPMDTYTMEFYQGDVLFTEPSRNVYVDNMLDIFEAVSGLYATLNART